MYETQRDKRTLEVKEAEIKSEIETGLVMGIKTPLDIISITLQTRRENDQESLSK